MKGKKSSLLMVFLLVVACSLFAQPNAEIQTIRIGIMPDVDSLPFMLASWQNLFEKQGVSVELVKFQSPVERDAAFQAGKIDGMVGDTLGALFLEQAGFDISILSVTNGRYGIAASPNGAITSLNELAGKEIAVSSNTIIEYLADSLVLSTGVAEADLKLIAVPKIPVRMELLLNGQIPAACLPEPLYTLVVTKGAKALGDSTSLPDAPGVMIFASSFSDKNRSTLTKVFKAYWEAGQLINANPDGYRTFLVEQAGFPQPVGPVFSFVTYEKPRVPTPSQVQKVVDWMHGRQLLDAEPSYGDLVDPLVVQAL
ncbi:ABC-type nitrate/sulfonate/bicarbonate transport system, periplasmic component [Sphaerochaeta pleomorpha str. Grapes]|uniref:ABC-type nitrate/sulfonate/bicarbonate transport system, periplasmic component n=1 Tax=Sphaerochaeta pleomorpha (strain ATCC BAA-1885 / DSM 22778 / Grapes) TaxID=158190 RepID=G8QQ67_SPHPG|nr:MetQ/NlpA family ABC transporter substrate-binding protein [Sphaerochaeta pleomorpha]AEV28644.1 ABC-type nitrate/sulfonate/bicarbonate transport system, periplasmic component [Sphaerochaeta pleomorpha str. Grapes]